MKIRDSLYTLSFLYLSLSLVSTAWLGLPKATQTVAVLLFAGYILFEVVARAFGESGRFPLRGRSTVRTYWFLPLFLQRMLLRRLLRHYREGAVGPLSCQMHGAAAADIVAEIRKT